MQRARFRRDAIWILLSILSLVPLAVFVYLGAQSRLLSDDYCHLGTGLKFGAWGNVLHWRENWNGSYSGYFFHGLVAPLGTVIPRIIPLIIIVLWLVGLVWLIFSRFAFLRSRRYRLSFAVAMGSAVLTATINAFFTPQSIYRYSASIRYSLPLAVLTLYLAATWELASRQQLHRWTALAAITGALVSFVNAGLSEMYLVLQLILFALSLPAVYVFLRGPRRRFLLVMFGSGLLASVISLIVQLTSPGVAIRAGVFVERLGVPNRSLSHLLSKSITQVWQYSIDSNIFAGFILLLSFGLFIMLIAFRPSKQHLVHERFRLAAPPLLFGFSIQLLCIPLLWNHASDVPQLLGRFSYAYSLVIVLNIVLVISLAVLLRERSRVNLVLQHRRSSWTALLYVTLPIVLLLFALTQLRSIHWRASTYIHVSCHLFLIISSWQLSLLLPRSIRRRFGAVAVCTYGATWLATISVLMVVFYTNPRVNPRILSFCSNFFVLHGLLWGIFLGFAMKHCNYTSPEGISGTRLLSISSLVTALLIGTGIFFGHVKLVPSFERYSLEWDSRHQHIIEARDRGLSTVTVAPLSFDLANYVGTRVIQNDICSLQYYKLDAIVLEES